MAAKPPVDDTFFTEEGKLQRENAYLKERVNNLEVFKKNFFATNYDLIDAREKIALLEESINLNKIRDNLIQSEETHPENIDDPHHDELMEFFHSSISADTFEDLVMSLFHAIEGLNIGMALQIKTPKQDLNYAVDADSKAQNINLIKQHRDEGELVEKDSYVVINLDYISVLGSDLPDAGKHRDNVLEYLKIMAAGANTRIDALIRRQELDRLNRNMYKIFKRTNDAFETLQDEIDTAVIDISELFLSCEATLTESFERLKLPADKIQAIELILSTTRADLNLMLSSHLVMDDKFIKVIKKLEDAYKPQLP
jgi:hypothetical protein